MALVLNRIRLPVSSARPRASLMPGTSSGLWQPRPVAVESPKIIRCRSNGTARDQRSTGRSPAVYTPSARGGASQVRGMTRRARSACPLKRFRAPTYAPPEDASTPAAANAIVDRRGPRMPTRQVYVRQDAARFAKLRAITDEYRIRYKKTVFERWTWCRCQAKLPGIGGEARQPGPTTA